MQIRALEKNVHIVKNETVNGLNVAVNLVASANNTDIADTQYDTGVSFDSSNIHIDVVLKRNGKSITMMSMNLGILAHMSTIMMGANQWYKGVVTKKKGASIKQEVTRSVFIPFFGHHNVKGSDEMVITVNVARDAFNTGVDPTLSTVLVTANQSIGTETGVYSYSTHAITANSTDVPVNLGDNVQRVAFLSFERDGMKPILKNGALTSDRLDWTAVESELRLKHYQWFPYNYADALISQLQNEDQVRYFPHTFVLHDKDEIDEAKLKLSFQSENIASSRNMICWISFQTSHEILQKAVQMEQKHTTENLAKVPVTIT